MTHSVIKRKKFGEQRLEVGGMHFQDCVFEKTTLVHSGGASPMFSGESHFIAVTFDFSGDAWETFAWIRKLRALFGPDAIEALLDIKDGKQRGASH